MTGQNCWEATNCGRQPGGSNTPNLGVCPSTTEKRLDKIHGGKNAGRCCWAIAGTLGGGARRGTFAQKVSSCLQCEFYQAVAREEGVRILPTALVLQKLK